MKNILIIDDEKEIVDIVSEELIEELKEFDLKIDHALDGLDGIIYITETKYDLIITDQKMPKMTGLEFIHNLQNIKSSLNTETPIIVLTGFSSQISSEELINTYIVDKPYDRKVFFKKVKNLIL